MPRFKRQQGLLPYSASESNEFTTGYKVFTFIRVAIRLCVCVGDCVMMETALADMDPSNRTLFQFKVQTLTEYNVALCAVCWVFKLLCVFVCESCVGRDIEKVLDIVSFLTLWIDEIPKTGFHLFIVCKHTQVVHRNYSGRLVLLSLYKLIERFKAVEEEYDWRPKKTPEVFNCLYVCGILIETVIALLSIAVAFM
ncbi:hypothetical protein BsWGS_21845 [Bradybaena similaris]